MADTAQGRLDLVIFGATGYTGRLAVRQARALAARQPGISWGVAGRDRAKLEEVLRENGADPGVAVILADLRDPASVRRMCERARVLVNCCGPYALHGAAVAVAAVRARAHYVDVSAEDQFTRQLERQLDAAARTADVCVLTACGLSSVPVDVGVAYLERHFDGTLDCVDSYLTTHASAGSVLSHWTHGLVRHSSWEAMILGMAQKHEPKEEERVKRPLLHRRFNRWCLPYPISDAFIVNRSQRRLNTAYGKRAVRYRPYIALPNLAVAIAMLLFYLGVAVLAKMSWTRYILLKYPRLCSFGMVAYERNTAWVKHEQKYEYVLVGSGRKDLDAPATNVIANITVRGADPAFDGTVSALLACADTVVRDRARLPHEGGVMTPGYAFYKTNLVQRLEDTGVYKYEIVAQGAIELQTRQ